MKNFNFQITDEAYKLLIQIRNEKKVEYLDTDYKTLDEFLNSSDFDKKSRNKDYFLKRNNNGTLYIIEELERFNLVEMDEVSWNQSYQLSNFAKILLENDYEFDF